LNAISVLLELLQVDNGLSGSTTGLLATRTAPLLRAISRCIV